MGLYRTQRLAKSLLSYTCYSRGAETRGKSAPLGRVGLLQYKAIEKKSSTTTEKTVPEKKRRETLRSNYKGKVRAPALTP